MLVVPRVSFRRRLWLLIFGLAVASQFLSGPVRAASQPTGISITPFLQEVKLGPNDKSKQLSVIFANYTNHPESLRLSVVDFGSLDNSGGVAFAGPQFSQLLDQYKLANWVTLDRSSLSLQPNQKVSTTLSIRNDKTLASGGHYAAVVGTVISPNGNGQTPIGLKAKITSLILATKTGGAKYDIQLQKIEHDGNLFRLPKQAFLTIRATGNTHIVPRGIVYLKDASGRVIKRGTINTESGYVLPGTDRFFTIELQPMSAPKLFSNRYYLQVDYRYDGINRFASQKIKLSYLNRWLVTVVLVLIVLAEMTRRGYFDWSAFLPAKYRHR